MAEDARYFVDFMRDAPEPTGEEVEDMALRDGVEALSKSCVDLNISVPVGKDSLSMRTKWEDGSVERVVKSPLSGVITAMAPVADVRNAVTPELNTEIPSKLIYVKLNNNIEMQRAFFRIGWLTPRNWLKNVLENKTSD